jgi:hypothetical protein
MRLDPSPARTTERCKLKGVTHAPAFRLHSTRPEGVAATRRVSMDSGTILFQEVAPGLLAARPGLLVAQSFLIGGSRDSQG